MSTFEHRPKPWSTGALAGALLVMADVVAAQQFDGNLRWARRVELSTPVSGVVERIPVEAGQRVEEGMGLLYLDQRRPKAEVNKAEAEAARLKRVLDEARRELERAQELYDRTLLSDHDLEVARIEQATAQARYAAARAALVEARLALEYSVIRAPFPAVVLSVDAEKGQTVVSELEARPLVTVAESGRMVVRITITEEQLDTVTEGGEATVVVGGREFTGRVASVGLEPASEIRPSGYPVDILFNYDPAQGQLRAGRKAEVRLR